MISNRLSTAPGGWTDIGIDFTQRCASIAIWGPTSMGKTTLALTAGGLKAPTALLHASEKIKGIVEPHVRMGKLVRAYNFGFVAKRGDDKENAKRAGTVWKKFEDLYDNAMDDWAKVVIVDTEPDAWALRRLARFGTLTPQGDTRDLYNAVNFDWAQMFKNKPREVAEGRGVTLITTHTCGDEYKDAIKMTPGGPKKVSEKTGKYKMDGQKHVKYWADVILWVEKGEDGQYRVRIDKGWFNGTVEGMVLDNEFMQNMGYEESPVTKSYLTIPAIMALITETPEEGWK